MASWPNQCLHRCLPIVLFLVPVMLIQAIAKAPQTPSVTPKSTPAPVASTGHHPGHLWWQMGQHQQWVVRSGDTMLTLMQRHHMPTREVYSWLALDPLVHHVLSHLKPDMVIDVCIKDHRLCVLSFPVDAEHVLMLSKMQGHWQHSIQAITPEAQGTRIRHFTLRRSFYAEARAAGLSAATIVQMHHVLGDRINFRKDLRVGDHFDVVLRANAQHAPTIEAIKYNHKGHTLSVMRYRTALGQVGYYTQKGHSILRSFDRYPMHFKRISSPFRKKRKHPILGFSRPHHGVDFAAPSGTPIFATASGQVHFVGRKHGYGNTVVIRHGRHYKTVYAHMSRFAKHLHSGSVVARHQLIGYVGMTGLATGPHCHYEFRINNTPQDPLKVKLPGAPALHGKDKDRFHEVWASMQAKIVQA